MKLIPLTQGKFATVDEDDFERVNQFKWYACFQRGRWYALRMIRTGEYRKPTSMHGFILGSKGGREIDHKSRNGLDNRRQNLRFATRSLNNANQRNNRGKLLANSKE